MSEGPVEAGKESWVWQYVEGIEAQKANHLQAPLSPSPGRFLSQPHSPWVGAPSVAGVLFMTTVEWGREDGGRHRRGTGTCRSGRCPGGALQPLGLSLQRPLLQVVFTKQVTSVHSGQWLCSAVEPPFALGTGCALCDGMTAPWRGCGHSAQHMMDSG